MMKSVSPNEKAQFMKELDIYGYSRLAGFIPNDIVSELVGKVEHCYHKSKANTYKGIPTRDDEDKILYNLQNKDKFFIDILTEPFIKEVCIEKLNDPYYRFLPENLGNYILSYYNARSSGKALDLHIDSYIPMNGDRTWSLQVVFVLQDMTIENGCTIVVPGSHRSGNYTDRQLENSKPVVANAGDLIVWDSRLWHGTKANSSNQSRWLLIATLTSWWIKQSMDITRSLPESIYNELSNEQKVMMGFCSIPPENEVERINTKTGYESLKAKVKDYWKYD